MHYKEICEQIYLNWRRSPDCFDDFSKDFQVNYLPEPYYQINCGDNFLFILNNNPGGALPFQEHSSLLKEFSDVSTYNDVSLWLMEKYTNDNAIISGAAKTRIHRITEIAKMLGYDGIKNIETFFLHSNNFDKIKFLKKYSQNNMIKNYKNSLQSYLTDKPVLIISAISTKKTLNLQEVSNNNWLAYQAEIAGLNLKQASFDTITIKDDKVTSGLVKYKNKFLVCTMGTNSIPKSTYLKIK